MIRMHGDLAKDLVPFDELTPHPENANNGDTDEIKASLIKHGCYRRVVVSSRTARILAGHHLAEALADLGSEIPVQMVDVDEAGERSILAADNKIARNAWMDPRAELALLRQIMEDVGTLDGTGSSEFDIARLEDVIDIGGYGEPGGESFDPGELDEHECPECGHRWRGSSAVDPMRGVEDG